jgi:hypothetical protein
MHMGLYVFFILLYFSLHVSGAICTHPQEHKLQRTAIGVCNGYGMLIHWSRYWLGHTHTFSTVLEPKHAEQKYRGIKSTHKPMYI